VNRLEHHALTNAPLGELLMVLNTTPFAFGVKESCGYSYKAREGDPQTLADPLNQVKPDLQKNSPGCAGEQ
jgi:hypothetical protein